ncbi:septum formation initiator family protein [Dysgonomonas sp. 520]|uniref:FtsB family cell division protein n=1 Tax=Dysgonomonas sp. 520 TaxID=2302931 RepID=UPI0013D32449|nr:septum formation initiator family protein [Dysgonomonas sp. 520]NDW08121.1 septum formation initiator family protein [Dysgonomonas sp. 520]
MGWISKYFSKLQIGIILVLIIFAFFLSDSNIFAHYEYKSEISSLNKQIEYYKKQKDENSRKLEELKSGKDNIEKFARENYLMKRDNEDVFVIENKKEDE